MARRFFSAARAPPVVVSPGGPGRRHDVLVDDTLTDQVTRTVHAVRALLNGTALPPPVNDKRCHRCSLRPGCLPDTVTPAHLFTP
ncbi:CRISPR-associated protein Cas4, partial [Saccharothrix sp. MB29]|nr:CRISPR-associated protein Cas4 [Saccharothrix sp. MB29]